MVKSAVDTTTGLGRTEMGKVYASLYSFKQQHGPRVKFRIKRLGKRVANAVALMLSVYLFVCLCVWPGENARIAIGWLKKNMAST